MLAHALNALKRGFHIFPVAPGQKIPHRMAGNWGQTATNDVNQVVRFWTQIDPTANIGVACKPSSLLVIDLDTAKKEWALKGTEWEYVHSVYGPMVSGEDLWDEMAFKMGDRLDGDTYTVRTGSCGLHLYYRWPSHWPRISQASPVKGVVDVRGNGGQYGGYVLGEGSRTEAGTYGYDLGRDSGFLLLPPKWIRQLVAEKPAPPKRPPTGPRPSGSVKSSGLVETVRNAGEGNRNNALLWAARTMCEERATENEALRALGPAASEAGLGDFEIERTIQSAYRVQRQKDGR